MSLLKLFGAAFSLSVVGFMALVAFVIFTPVTTDNVSLRLSIVCRSYRFMASFAPSDNFELAWARNIDCGCVRDRITTKNSVTQYAQFLEQFRVRMLENIPAALDGAAPNDDSFDEEAGQHVAATLPVTLARCQKQSE